MARYRELTRALAWTALILFVYALGQFIPMPGVNAAQAGKSLASVGYLQMLAMGTGGQLSTPTIFSIGMGPYMSSMIVWQAISTVGSERIGRWSQYQVGIAKRILTFVFAIIQSIQVVWFMRGALVPMYVPGIEMNVAVAVAMLILVGGAMMVTWLADMNAALGVGSTVALILPGMLLRTPYTLQHGFGDPESAVIKLTAPTVTIAVAIGLLVAVAMVFVSYAELDIPVASPMIDTSRKQSVVPMKIMSSGGMPFMFSGSLFMLPKLIVGQGSGFSNGVQQFVVTWFSFHTVQGVISYAIVLFVLDFAFGYINVQPTQLAKGLKESGDYIYGVAPGDATERALMQHFNRLSLLGHLMVLAIGVGPMIVGLFFRPAANYSAFLGSFLIMVGIGGSIKDQIAGLWRKNRYRVFD